MWCLLDECVSGRAPTLYRRTWESPFATRLQDLIKFRASWCSVFSARRQQRCLRRFRYEAEVIQPPTRSLALSPRPVSSPPHLLKLGSSPSPAFRCHYLTPVASSPHCPTRRRAGGQRRAAARWPRRARHLPAGRLGAPPGRLAGAPASPPPPCRRRSVGWSPPHPHPFPCRWREGRPDRRPRRPSPPRRVHVPRPPPPLRYQRSWRRRRRQQWRRRWLLQRRRLTPPPLKPVPPLVVYGWPRLLGRPERRPPRRPPRPQRRAVHQCPAAPPGLTGCRRQTTRPRGTRHRLRVLRPAHPARSRRPDVRPPPLPYLSLRRRRGTGPQRGRRCRPPP